MAGPAPKTDKWSAHENKHKPSGLHVIVYGSVQVSDADKAPVLAKGSGGGAKVLPLNLSISNCGDPAIKAAVWKQAKFHAEVKADEYEQVQILWDGKAIANVPVLNDAEHSEQKAALTKRHNATAPKPKATKPKAKPAKAAPKKAAAKKASKSVAKKAKKAAKKTAKKSARRPAKKAAKKSTLKRFVRGLVKKLTPGKAKKKKGSR